MKTSNKSRTMALLLAFLFAPFGAHRLYVGKGGTAILMFLLSITVYGMIITLPWGIVDFVRIAIGSFTDKEGLVITNWN